MRTELIQKIKSKLRTNDIDRITAAMTTKAKALKTEIENSDLGCKKRTVARLLSILLGEEICLSLQTLSEQYHHTVAVTNSLQNGTIVFIYNDGDNDLVAIDSNATYLSPRDLMKATDQQINAFFETASLASLFKIAAALNIEE